MNISAASFSCFALVLALTAGQGRGETSSITAMLTVETNTSAATSTSVIGGGSSFPVSRTYNVNYAGNTRALQSYTAGGETYVPIPYDGAVDVSLRRSDATPLNDIVWGRINTSSGGTNNGATYNLAGPQQTSEAGAYGANNFNAGTDNLFTNTGNASGNNNNVERLDVVFSSGLVVRDGMAFSVWDRSTNVSYADDGFQIAAITAIDSFGMPLSYATLVTFTGGNWGDTNLNTSLGSTSFNTLVVRDTPNTASSSGEPIHPSDTATGRTIHGESISIAGSTGTQGLGITPGDTIYGYSLFAGDVTGSGAQLLNWKDSSFFPTNTPDNSVGGIDLLAYTGQVYMQVPEPSGASLSLLALAGLLSRRGRN